jgi:hypothetical protein
MAAPLVALQLGEIQAILDLADPNDRKYYTSAIKPLDDSEKFDLSPLKLRAFIDNVRSKSELHCWEDVLTVPTVDAAGAAVNMNLLDYYGIVSMIDCTAHATAYMGARVRTAQNAAMLYHFLVGSLTMEAKNTVNIETAQFTIAGTKDGLTFLKTIIMKAQLDTVGTVETLRNAVSGFPVKLTELAGNIIDFHKYVNGIKGALDSYSESYPELISNLFKAYALVEDTEFQTYIMMTRFEYRRMPMNYNASVLMNGIENLYKIRIESGTWNPSIANQVGDTKNTISAMTSSVENTRDKKRKEKYAWKKEVPKNGEATTKSFEGRVYHWCVNHKMWTMHKPEECKGVDFRRDNEKGNNNIVANTATIMPIISTSETPVVPAKKAHIVEEDPELKVREAMFTIGSYSTMD